MKTAAAYYRMSTQKQDKSISAQREEVERYALTNGYKIVREYIDEGISGDKTEKRAAFREMIENAGEVKSILCWNQDRFGRFDSLEAGYWIKPLRDAGVRLITIDKGVIDWNSFTGRVMAAIEQEGKHTFLTDLSRNVSRGMGRQAALGLWQGGNPPYGYQTNEEKRLVIVPEQAIIVRRIFERYLTGDTLRTIAKELNEDGISSPRPERGSGMWSYSVVRTILKNETHAGVYTFGKRAHGKYYRPSPNGPEEARGKDSDHFRIENNHEAIITAEEFAAVMERMDKNRTRRTPHTGRKSPFVLSGLMFCSHCEKVMYGSHDASQRPRYVCGGFKSGGKPVCDCNSVYQSDMVQTIAEHVQRWSENSLGLLASRIREKVEAENNPKRIKELRDRLSSIEGELEEMETRLLKVDSDMMHIVQEKIRELRGEKQDVSHSLRAAQQAMETASEEVEDITERAVRMTSEIRLAMTESDPRTVRSVMQNGIERVGLEFTERTLSGGVLMLKFPSKSLQNKGGKMSEEGYH